MRKITFIIFMYCSLTGLGQQKVSFTKRFVYELSYSLDSLNPSQRKQEFVELLLNDSISLYQSVNKGILDSINQNLYKNGNTFGDWASTTRYASEFDYYIIKSPQQISYYEYIPHFKDGLTTYHEAIMDQKWELNQQFDTIANFACQSATMFYGGRTWTAWFCSEIPVFDGPYKFCNLPGLIVKISDKTSSWGFILKNIENNINRKFYLNEFPKRPLVKMNKEDFKKSLKYFEENKISIQESTGDLSFPTPQDRAIIIENYKNNLKKRNNRIEL